MADLSIVGSEPLPKGELSIVRSEPLEPRTWLDSAKDYAKGFWNNLSQAGEGMVNAVKHPVDTLAGIGSAQDALRLKAEDAFKKGDYATGARHVLEYALPVVGPQVSQLGDEAQSGNVAHALGGATALGLQLAGPGALAEPSTAAAVGGAMQDTGQAVARGARAVGAGAKAAGPDVTLGALKAGAGTFAAEELPIPTPLKYILAYEPIKAGAKQVGRGLVKGYQAAKANLAASGAPEAVAAPPLPPTLSPNVVTASNPLPPEVIADLMRESEAPPAAPPNTPGLPPRMAGPATATPEAAAPVNGKPRMQSYVYEPEDVEPTASKQMPGAVEEPLQQMAQSVLPKPAAPTFMDQLNQFKKDKGIVTEPEEVAPEPDLMAQMQASIDKAKGVLPKPEEGATVQPEAPNENLSANPQGESGPIPQPRQPSGTVAQGSTTKIPVPGESQEYGAHYAVRELDDVHPSHNPQTFEKNPDYHYQNDRNYSDPVNQERIVVNSQKGRFNPSYLITDNPDAMNGPPVIEPEGNVLGGNNRTMILSRVYGGNPEGAAAYKQALQDRASYFGIDPQQVAGMKRPVLVREIDEASLNPQRAITDMNKSGTAALTQAERATADARMVSPQAIDKITAAIDAEGPDASLSDVLSGRNGVSLINSLVDDGVITMQEKPQLVDSRTGSITAAGKERVSKMLLGQMFRDSEQIQRIEPALRNKLEKVAGPVTALRGKAGWDIRPDVQNAVDLLEYARAHGIKNLGDAVGQEDMFGNAPKFDQKALSLAEAIKSKNPTALSKAFRQYAGDSEPTMFGESTPDEAFQLAFGN